MTSFQEILDEAEKLGLEVEGHDARGVFEQRPVRIVTHWGRDTTLYSAWGLLEPPMDLGLDLRRRALMLTTTGLSTGSDHLDAEYRLAGDERDRVERLFTAELAAAMVTGDRAGWAIILDDRGVNVNDQLLGADPATSLRGAVEVAVRIARAADEARAKLAPANDLDVQAAAIQRVAIERGFTFLQAPVWAEGDAEGRRVSIGTRRIAPGRHALGGAARFKHPLGLDLHVRPRGLIGTLGAIVGRREVRTDHAELDRRLVVRVRPGEEKRTQELFDAGVRAALLELLDQFGAVAIDDLGLAVGPVPMPLDAARAALLLELAMDAATGLDRLGTGALPAGPYR
jgi:hypothetical protein